MAVVKLQRGKFVLALTGGTIFVFFSLYLLIFKNIFEFPVFFLLIFGSICLFYGVHYLINRKNYSIIVDKDGIIVLHPGKYIHIRAEQITLIHNYGSLEKPRIEITFKDGEVLHFFIPSYCKPAIFLKHCKDSGLPCA